MIEQNNAQANQQLSDQKKQIRRIVAARKREYLTGEGGLHTESEGKDRRCLDAGFNAAYRNRRDADVNAVYRYCHDADVDAAYRNCRDAHVDAAYRNFLAEMSAQIIAQILSLAIYRDARTVFVYMDVPGEVQTRSLIERCLSDGKKVAIPRVEGQAMRFYGIESFAHVSVPAPVKQDSLPDKSPRVKLLIPEPDPAFCPCMDGEEDALVIMPGVAYDRSLNRIGYGGGFYDRYLQVHRHHPTAAVAFHFQVFDCVPHEDTDIRPQLLITDREIIR